jgi:hypothetical protein
LSPLLSPLRWRRFARLGREQRRLRLEAVARIILVLLDQHRLSFEQLVRSAARAVGTQTRATPRDVAEAVRWAAAVLPLRTVCMHQGLACQIMLRRRGVDAQLHYGLTMIDGLKGHVWVTVAGEPVIGGEEADRFEQVAMFPG